MTKMCHPIFPIVIIFKIILIRYKLAVIVDQEYVPPFMVLQ